MPKADDIDNISQDDIPQDDIPQDDIPRNVVPVTTGQLDLRLARDTLETLQDAAAIQGLTFVQRVERLWTTGHRSSSSTRAFSFSPSTTSWPSPGPS